jgi:hypothetical protein
LAVSFISPLRIAAMAFGAPSSVPPMFTNASM